MLADYTAELGNGYRPRALSGSIISDEALGQVKLWLDECDENHDECVVVGHHTGPSMLLDIGTPEMLLVRLQACSNQKASYMTLSHCWGTDVPTRLLTSNLDEMHTEIDYDS